MQIIFSCITLTWQQQANQAQLLTANDITKTTLNPNNRLNLTILLLSEFFFSLVQKRTQKLFL